MLFYFTEMSDVMENLKVFRCLMFNEKFFRENNKVNEDLGMLESNLFRKE